jgi:hypothetical protein
MAQLNTPQLNTPRFDPAKGFGSFFLEMGKYQKQLDAPKKQAIIDYINEWMNYKGDEKLKSLTFFRNKYVEYLPNDQKSKKFLIKNFEKYNQLFKLDLEYNEELFTKYNVLYMLKLMLKEIEFDLKKEKTDTYKRYSIICKKKTFAL